MKTLIRTQFFGLSRSKWCVDLDEYKVVASIKDGAGGGKPEAKYRGVHRVFHVEVVKDGVAMATYHEFRSWSKAVRFYGRLAKLLALGGPVPKDILEGWGDAAAARERPRAP